MNKVILVLIGVLFATATAKQYATSVYANDFANAAAAQYSTGNTLAYSNIAVPTYSYPYYGGLYGGYVDPYLYGGYGYVDPYLYGGYGYVDPYYGGLYGGGLWGSPISSTNFYSDSYTNAAAAQYSAGNQLAFSSLASPYGIYFKRK